MTNVILTNAEMNLSTKFQQEIKLWLSPNINKTNSLIKEAIEAGRIHHKQIYAM